MYIYRVTYICWMLSKVVAILNPKGGSGKTTLATNVGGCLHKREYKTLIIDTDPQGSALEWQQSQSDSAPDLPLVVGIDKPVLHKKLPSIVGDYDFLIVDGAALVSEITVSAVKVADIVLIPVRHSGFDIRAVDTVVDAVQTMQSISGGRPMASFVISSQASGSILARSVDDALSQMELPVFQSRTSRRVAYEEAAALGVTVMDLSGRQKASQEIESITSELLNLLS